MTFQNCLPDRPASRCITLAGLVLGMLATLPAQAKIVTLSFSGKYVALDTIFGVALQDEPLPYSYQLTYDTSLNTNDFHVTAGSQLGDYLTTHDWYGYSASGLIAANVSFGNKTWAISDLQARLPAVGVSADLWFDTDIAQTTPGRSWLFFASSNLDGSTASAGIGDGLTDGVTVQLTNSSYIFDNAASASSQDLSISAVPEPQALWLVPAGMLALWLARQKRRRA